MTKQPRFTVWLPLYSETVEFFTLSGAAHWIRNEKERGRSVSGATIKDNETGEYIDFEQVIGDDCGT